MTACRGSVARKHQKETDSVNGEVFCFLFAFPATEIHGFLGRRKHTTCVYAVCSETEGCLAVP